MIQNLAQGWPGAGVSRLGWVLAAGLPLSGLSAFNTPLPTGLPPGFEAVIFAAPPMINYPTFLCPGETGELFVSVDKNASIDTKPDRGFIVKLIDEDGDGKADRRTEFAQVTSPRGLAYDGEWVYCLHPPTLSRFRDTDGDGVSDERQELVSGIGFDLTQRPPDHTSNGVTLAIDGWLYLAIGDFGFMEARGSDGRTLQLHAGGVVRVRPDGTELEVFATGARNIYEVAVDPWLNVFARDNTNDGDGWDIKVHAFFHGADMGYPRRFKHFADETMPSLGVYGGGSGTGATFIDEPAVPAPFGTMLYTADWGRNAIYYHPLKGEKAAWFDIGQETFCQIERPTTLQADRSGNIYIASWKGGEYTYKGENVGYIALVRAPAAQQAAPTTTSPPLTNLSAIDLARQLASPSHTRRLAAQRAILRRPADARPVAEALRDLLENNTTPRTARIAILATLKQLMGPASATLIGRHGAGNPALKEFAIRLTGDRPAEAPPGVVPHIIAALKDPDDHVKTQAVIALSRLGRTEAAPEILALAAQAPDTEAETATAAEPRASTPPVTGTDPTRLHQLTADITGARKLFLVVTDGGNGNGVDHADWVEPLLRGPSGATRLTDLPWSLASAGWSETRTGLNAIGQPLRVAGQPVAWGIGTHALSVIRYDLPEGHSWTSFTTRAALDDSSVHQNPEAGRVQFEVYIDVLPPALAAGASQSTNETATDHRRALPHLASRALIRLQAHEACFAALDTHSDPATRAAALRVLRHLHLPEVVTGLIERSGKTEDPALRRGLLTTLIRLYFQEAPWDGSSWGTRPDTTGPYYKRATWSESPRIEAAVRTALARSAAPEARALAAQLRRHSIPWDNLPPGTGSATSATADPQWAVDAQTLADAMAGATDMKPGAVGLLEPAVAIERTLAALSAGHADAAAGEKLFTSRGCAACHSVAQNAAPKGPNLHDITQRYQPAELLMSLLNPSATIAQGFPTHVIETKNGDSFAGFIISESGDAIVLRNMAALTQIIRTDTIKARHKEEAISSMTPGLVNPLQPAELASLLKYLQGLAK